ncbi:hypothetical protein C8A05DRAFT_31039 [Staphylotrichum tortipilum]|uniref:Uncharacterized protein n=1 Tax=Staphylotrichum tortipilum TaxID=2831512 RepID=A0AAN6RW43_9PEZI|nr:hypothetical protein C8A05DRAFT_31039 [Staphylotrichum longicolle]
MLNEVLHEPAGFMAPAAYIFRPAWPAVSGVRIPTSLRNRQSGGSTCGTGETTCPQAGWCCGASETCTQLGGAFFCCPAGAGAAGCTRVCAAGDFQCGSICCAEGQTCGGVDTLSPFCTNESSTSLSSAVATSTKTSPQSSMSTSSSSSSSSTSLSSSKNTSTTASSSTRSSSHTTLPSTSARASTIAAPTTTASPSPSSPSATPTSTAASQHGGIPLAGQIAIGVIVPVAVILMVGALWYFVFRRPSDGWGGRGHHRWGTGTTSFGSRGRTPPPAYAKSGLDTVVVSPISTHESIGMGSSSGERGREEGAGIEMGNLGTATGGSTDGGTPMRAEAAPVSSLSTDSRVFPRVGTASPHPGTAVVV